MARIQISKNLINSIASQDNQDYLEKVQNTLTGVLSASVNELSEKLSCVTKNNVVLQPINEVLNGAFCDNSTFVYLLGVENAQLEISTAKKSNYWAELWRRFKYAWANRRKKKKNKKKKIDAQENKVEIKDISKYSIYDLTQDFQQAIANNLSETSIIYSSANQILILGKDDFGSNTKIKIYVVSKNEKYFRYYAGRRKGYIDIDVTSRCDMINQKIQKVGHDFILILKILNVLFYNANGRLPNQIFMESILYSIPDELYNGDDIHSIFVKIINYLSIKTIKNIMSINNNDKTIFTDEICGEETYAFIKMMNFIANND